MSIDDSLKKSIEDFINNKYIKNSQVLVFNKKHALNLVNILKLKEKFLQAELIFGLKTAQETISKDFYTLSYLVRFIQRQLEMKQSR
jgi:hypothetical protein